jgi:hypothetical protein
MINETPQMYVRRILSDISNSSSMTSVYTTLKLDLKLTPYIIPVLQHLKDSDVNQRFDFSISMTDNAVIIKNVWLTCWAFFRDSVFIYFSDESHLYLDKKLNKQTIATGQMSDQIFLVETSCHAEKVTV